MLGSLVAWVALASGMHYENAGASARRVVEDLARASGTRMEAVADFERDIVAVRWRDKPLEAIRAELAERLAGEWEREGEILRLVRSREALRKEAVAERETVARVYDTELARHRKLGDPDRPPTAAEFEGMSRELHLLAQSHPESGWAERSRAIARRGPIDRLLLRILEVLGHKVLEEIPRGEGRVYTFAPNRRQLKLPEQVRGAVADCLSDWRLWNRVAGTAQPTGKHIETDPRFLAAPLASVNPYLLVRRSEDGASVQHELLLADDEGQVAARANLWLGVPVKVYWDTNERPHENAHQTLLRLDEDARMMGRLLTLGNTESPLRKRPGLRDQVLQPQVHDPLSLAVGVALIAAAEALDKDLFALLPDESAGVLPIWAKSERPTAEALFEALTNKGCKVETGDSQIDITPVFPALARSTRVNRGRLASLLSEFDQTGSVKPESLAAYARASGTPQADPIVMIAANALSAGGSGAVTVGDWTILGLLGSLGDNRWATSDGKFEVPIGSSADLLARADLLFVRHRRSYHGFLESVENLACMRYPLPLRPTATLSVATATAAGVLCGHEGLPDASASEERVLIEMLATKGLPDNHYTYTTFRLGTLRHVLVEFAEAARHPMNHGAFMTLFQGDFRQPQLLWDDLPVDRMREWEKQAAALRKSMDDALASRKPPPPPQS